MRALLKRIILWALSSGDQPVNSAADLDSLAKQLKR